MRVILTDTLLAAYDRECYSEHPFHEREDNIHTTKKNEREKKIKKKNKSKFEREECVMK